jgi:hypothetical protein
MNSTEMSLGALFDEVLLPMHDHMRAEGRLPFPVAPDVTWLSYYVRRKHSSMEPRDFSAASCADLGELSSRLAAHWEGIGRHALAKSVGRVVSAAKVAREGNEPAQASAEVSPYVYVMF